MLEETLILKEKQTQRILVCLFSHYGITHDIHAQNHDIIQKSMFLACNQPTSLLAIHPKGQQNLAFYLCVTDIAPCTL